MEEKEDQISSLPDPIIHQILSSLPSTKQAIQTGILSKRWYKQWTLVHVLIFDISDFPNEGTISSSDISRFIQDTLSLHDCSIVDNFCLEMGSFNGHYKLPEFLFNNASLKISTVCCTFMPNGKVNWECLTTLFMDSCTIPHQAVVQHILSGSPLLKSLELHWVYFDFEKLVVSSKSLKRFVLMLPSSDSNYINDVEFSCPRLEELSLDYLLVDGDFCSRLDQSIQNVLSNCLSLESLELTEYRGLDNLVIASKSLKRLVLSDLYDCSSIDCTS